MSHRHGRFVEFYGPQQVLGLRRTYRPRGGYALIVGFLRRLAWPHLGRAVEAG